MGNVSVIAGRSDTGELSPFQVNKLTFDFNTFFDLNSDGYLSYKVNRNNFYLSNLLGFSLFLFSIFL
jgi:hypothetical protein